MFSPHKKLSCQRIQIESNKNYKGFLEKEREKERIKKNSQLWKEGGA